MKTIKKVVNEDTLELEEITIERADDEEMTVITEEECKAAIQNALKCSPEEFLDSFMKYKRAEKEFKKLFDPFKKNLIELHKEPSGSQIPNTVIVGGIKVTYVSPSTRTTIDTKKLKEEEPELAKKFSKTTNVEATVRLEGRIM